jgi:hypothetical protein
MPCAPPATTAGLSQAVDLSLSLASRPMVHPLRGGLAESHLGSSLSYPALVGTWGVGVFDDDIALDVRDGFRS